MTKKGLSEKKIPANDEPSNLGNKKPAWEDRKSFSEDPENIVFTKKRIDNWLLSIPKAEISNTGAPPKKTEKIATPPQEDVIEPVIQEAAIIAPPIQEPLAIEPLKRKPRDLTNEEVFDKLSWAIKTIIKASEGRKMHIKRVVFILTSIKKNGGAGSDFKEGILQDAELFKDDPEVSGKKFIDSLAGRIEVSVADQARHFSRLFIKKLGINIDENGFIIEKKEKKDYKQKATKIKVEEDGFICFPQKEKTKDLQVQEVTHSKQKSDKDKPTRKKARYVDVMDYDKIKEFLKSFDMKDYEQSSDDLFEEFLEKIKTCQESFSDLTDTKNAESDNIKRDSASPSSSPSPSHEQENYSNSPPIHNEERLESIQENFKSSNSSSKSDKDRSSDEVTQDFLGSPPSQISPPRSTQIRNSAEEAVRKMLENSSLSYQANAKEGRF